MGRRNRKKEEARDDEIFLPIKKRFREKLHVVQNAGWDREMSLIAQNKPICGASSEA